MRNKERKFYQRIVIGVLAGINILSLTACGTSVKASNMQDARPAAYMETTDESYSVYMNYNGFVAADEMRNLPFEVSGTLKSVYVEKGQQVKEGDILAELDTTTLEMSINSAKQDILLAQNGIAIIDCSIEAAQVNLETMKISYKQANDAYHRASALYEVGAISQKDLEDAAYAFETMKNNIALQTINITAMESECEAANLKMNQAHIALELNNKQLSDAVLRSNMDGYVVEVTARPGAVVGAGTPIIVIKSGESVVNIGVSVSDFNKIKEGMPVTLTHYDVSFSGKVGTVSLYPDESTGTYNVKIIPEKEDLVMGTLLDVTIPTETKSGVFIPMQAVINISGVNYVYCAESDGVKHIAVRSEVILGDVRGEQVLAENLPPGQIVITEGVRNLRDNDIVIID